MSTMASDDFAEYNKEILVVTLANRLMARKGSPIL